MSVVQLTESEARLHSRSVLAGYEPARLFASSVLVVGAGALGQNVLQNLALAGVGNLAVVDFDDFEPHNATRSPLYPSMAMIESIGVSKAIQVARRVRDASTAPEPNISYAHCRVQDLGIAAVNSFDVVVAAVDSMSARAYLSETCRAATTPIVEGGFSGDRFSYTIDLCESGAACYRCSNPLAQGSFSCTDYALESERAEIIPAIQNTAAALASFMSEAIIGLIHDRDVSARKVVGSIREPFIRPLRVDVDRDCPGVHVDGAECHQLHVTGNTLGDLVDAAEDHFVALKLPEPFVIEMSCRRCGVALRPLVPQSEWLLNPECDDCSVAPSGYEVFSGEFFVPLECSSLEFDQMEDLGIATVDLGGLRLSEDAVLILTNSSGCHERARLVSRKQWAPMPASLLAYKQ